MRRFGIISGMLIIALAGILFLVTGATQAHTSRPLALGAHSAGPPLAKLLNADGTLNLSTGYAGTLDPAGWRMQIDAAGRPHFVPVRPGDENRQPSVDPPGTDGYVRAIAVSGSTIFIGGVFTHAGGVAANRIAAWNGSSWSALGSGMDLDVDALAVSGNTLYAGGVFTHAGGVIANKIAAWNGSSWSALGSGMNDTVLALAVSGNTLYAGGSFTNAGGVPANDVAAWNGSSWSALGSGTSSRVWTLAVIGGTLYAGGDFVSAGGIAANHVAAWNGSSWSALGSGTDGAVYALAVSGSTLYVGGWFTHAGGVTVNNVAAWDGSSWSAFSSGMDYYVESLVASGSTLYAGGGFDHAGGMAVNRIAAWNGSSWRPLGSGMSSSNSFVYALVMNGSTLYAGGQFPVAGGVVVNNIATWDGSSWNAVGLGSATSTPTPMPQPTGTPGLGTIDTVTFAQPHYPDTTFQTVNSSAPITDGNVLRIQVGLTNHGPVNQTFRVRFIDAERNLPLPDARHSLPDATVTVTAGPGQQVSVAYYWDTLGYAWDSHNNPHLQQRLRIALETLNGALQDAQEQTVNLRPKPLILVHGLSAHWQDWDAYKGYLQQVTTTWHGYAPGDGQVPGIPDMDMGDRDHPISHLTNTMSQNSAILAAYVEGIRIHENSWHLDLVAHSMGGLVSRQYIRFLMPTNSTSLDNRPAVTHLVQLGTPNLGTPCADVFVVLGVYTPAIYEITPPAGLIFTLLVHDLKRVDASILAGDALSFTCQDLLAAGDGVVPEWSAEWQGIPTQSVVYQWHTDLTSSYNFDNFVRGQLAVPPRQELGLPQFPEVRAHKPDVRRPADISISPQVVFTISQQLPSGATVDLSVPLPMASGVGVGLITRSDVASILRDPTGGQVDEIMAGSNRALAPMQILSSTNPMVGTWTVHLTNTGSTQASVDGVVWVTGNPFQANLAVGDPTLDGRVPLTTTLTNNNAPVLGASVLATINDTTPRATLQLLDDGQHNDGQPNDGIYGGTSQPLPVGSYGIVVNATVAGQVYITASGVMVGTSCTLSFSDVTPSDYFYIPVSYLACYNILSGYADGTFRPYNNTTRGQLAKIIVNAVGGPVDTSEGPHFTDVPSSNPFYSFIETAYNRGIISGYEDGTFRWGSNVTRGQLSKIIVVAEGWPIDASNGQHFSDVPPGNPFYSFIETAFHYGIISGYTCGGVGEQCDPQQRPYFRWGAYATRGQIAKIIYNAITAGSPPTSVPTPPRR